MKTGEQKETVPDDGARTIGLFSRGHVGFRTADRGGPGGGFAGGRQKVRDHREAVMPAGTTTTTTTM